MTYVERASIVQIQSSEFVALTYLLWLRLIWVAQVTTLSTTALPRKKVILNDESARNPSFHVVSFFF